MYDRYGASGFLAAYNAGPGRYEAYLAHERGLADETLRYVAAVGAVLGKDPVGHGFGDLLPAGQNAPSLPEPISISPDGELLGRAGQPLPVAERLVLHRMVAKAVGRAARR
jgi:hypothetical protein